MWFFKAATDENVWSTEQIVKYDVHLPRSDHPNCRQGASGAASRLGVDVSVLLDRVC